MNIKNTFCNIFWVLIGKDTRKINYKLSSLIVSFVIILIIDVLGKFFYITKFNMYLRQISENINFLSMSQYLIGALIIAIILILNLFIIGIVTMFINKVLILDLYKGYRELYGKLIMSWFVRTLAFVFLGLIYWLKLEFEDYEVSGIVLKIGLDMFVDIHKYSLFIQGVIVHLNIFFVFWSIIFFKIVFKKANANKLKKIGGYIIFLILVIPLEVLMTMVFQKYLGVLI